MGQCLGGKDPNGPDRAAISRDQKIANQNKTDFDKSNRVIKLLLLGAGESGKSTIFKQISIINGKEPTKEELEENVPVVHMNIFNNILLLLEYSVENGLDFGDMKQDVDEFMQKYDKNSELTAEAVQLIKAFWNSDWGQQAWTFRADYQILDALEYFMEHIDRITSDDYLPTKADFLHSRIRSTGIVTANYKMKGANFQILDVGGQRNERRKWIHCFDNVTAIIFVAAINEYDQKLYEDSKTHRITEALNLFQEQLDNPLFEKTPIILFLNKIDLFKEKLAKKPLESVYPDFQGPYYDPAKGGKQKQAEKAAQEYMKEKFLAVSQTERTIYTYFTTATDEENVTKVFNSTRDIVLQQAMETSFF